MKNHVIAALALAASTALTPHLANAATESAIFAGGCFWCVEEAFDQVAGVVATTSGYTGGGSDNPTYRQVSSGGTGHFEAVKVDYDPAKVTYEQLLQTFWRNIDPLDPAGQFCDKGESYRSAVFVGADEERQLAEASLAAVAKQLDQPVATEILPEKAFYAAEPEHQDYYQRNAAQYKYYKYGCGRAQRLQEIWGDPAA